MTTLLHRKLNKLNNSDNELSCRNRTELARRFTTKEGPCEAYTGHIVNIMAGTRQVREGRDYNPPTGEGIE